MERNPHGPSSEGRPDPSGAFEPLDPTEHAIDDGPLESPVASFGSPLGGDDQTIKKIQRHTTRFGRIAAVLLIVSALVIGAVYWRRGDAYEHRMEGVEAAGKSESVDKMLELLRAELKKAEFDDVKERVIMNLGHFRDAKSVPLLIESLGNAGIVRRAAALALARIGLPAAESARSKLLEVLPDTDARDRPQVVWALAVLHESKASDAILDSFSKGLLQGQPGFDPKVITDVLGTQRLASPALIGHSEEAVRVLVAQALSEAASTDVVAPLGQMLRQELARPADKQSPEVIRAAAAGLGRTGDARAADPLFELLQKQPSMRPSVLDAIQRSTSAPAIAALLTQAKEIELRRGLAQALRATHDARAADPLAALLGDDDKRLRAIAAMGLAELGDSRSAPVLIAIGSDTDDALAKEALAALEKMGRSNVASELTAMLGNFPARKASILRALGATGASSAAKTLEKELGGDDVQAAAFALADLKDPAGYKRLLSMAKRPSKTDFSQPKVENETAYRNRIIAVQTLGRYGDPSAAPLLMEIIEDSKDDPRIRNAAGASLGAVASAEQFATVVTKVKDSSVQEASRRYYARALWQKPRPEAVQDLLGLIGSDAPAEAQRGAGIALGYASDASLDNTLIQLLNAPKTRREAAFAVILGGGEASARRLTAWLREDRDLREVVQDAVLGDENDWFNVLTTGMFDSGQVYRRLHVAEILREGDAESRYGFPWAEFITRLKTGGEGPLQASARAVRQKLLEGLRGADAERRRLAADALAAMLERGLLLAVRDAGGPGSVEARAALRGLDDAKAAAGAASSGAPKVSVTH